MTGKAFYRSSNGDQWYLVQEPGPRTHRAMAVNGPGVQGTFSGSGAALTRGHSRRAGERPTLDFLIARILRDRAATKAPVTGVSEGNTNFVRS